MSHLVCINGSPRRVSRTGVLVDAVAAAIAAHVAVERRDMITEGAQTFVGLDGYGINIVSEHIIEE